MYTENAEDGDSNTMKMAIRINIEVSTVPGMNTVPGMYTGLILYPRKKLNPKISDSILEGKSENFGSTFQK